MTIRTPALQALIPLSSTTGSVLCRRLGWTEIPALWRLSSFAQWDLHGSEVLRRACGECGWA
jgi:hypothetical protein